MGKAKEGTLGRRKVVTGKTVKQRSDTHVYTHTHTRILIHTHTCTSWSQLTLACENLLLNLELVVKLLVA